MIEREFFGTDGVRGIANLGSMTPEFALELGRALGVLIKKDTRIHQVVIGKDTRVSGYMLETALSSGLCSVGVDVWLCGPLPTPGIAFLTHSMRADAGVMISASHNSFEDNGIKIFGPDGFKLRDDNEVELEELLKNQKLKMIRPIGSEIGKAHRIDDAVGRYIVYLKSTFPKTLNLVGVRIVVDAGHGAAYRVAPAVFTELGATVTLCGADPNGININDGCGALQPNTAQQLVKNLKYDLGIALDGDADRVTIIDDEGQILDGDHLLAIFASWLNKNDKLRGGGIVATIMSNLGLELSLQSQGLRLHRTPVGDRYVMEKMCEGNFNLGGEQSGHIIWLDHSTTGDGLLAVLLLLTIAKQMNVRVSELKKCMTAYPQHFENVLVTQRRPLGDLALVQTAIRDAEATLGNHGRVLVRYSGTELKARVMVEGRDHAMIYRLANHIADAIKMDLA